jgi:hypothetical protein
MTNLIKQKLEDILDDESLNVSTDNYDELVQKLTDLVINTVSKTTKKAKKPKKPIDPNAPKRPLTAYLSFSNDNRQSMKNELEEENHGAKILVTDVAKRLGEKWKNLETENPVEYNAYKDKANTLSALYKSELSKYYDSDDYKSFIESEEYIEWKEFADKKKEEKKKAPKKVTNKPFEFQPIPEEKLKTVLQIAKNYFLVDYVKTYQDQIDTPDSPLTLALVKKNFSAMIKEHSLVRNRNNHITDDDLFTTETTYTDLLEELSEIKKQFVPVPDTVYESVSNEDDLITDDEEEEQSGCKHIFDRGNNKNKRCGKSCVDDSEYCRSHNN